MPIKNLSEQQISSHEILIIDEAQRIYPDQLEKIILSIQEKKKIIFSYDQKQTLSRWEERNEIDNKIQEIKTIKIHKLSEKIRTNKEIGNFIRMFFDKNKNLNVTSTDNIEINYFKNIINATKYCESLDQDKWQTLRFTPSQYNTEHHEKYSSHTQDSSHKIIGQEFDGVCLIVDQFFFYTEDGFLDYKAYSYYDPVKMLSQNMTRARKRLKIVIINNQKI